MSELNNLTVLGTGVLGSQIIMQAAWAGKNVVGYDISDEILAKLPARWDWLKTNYARDLADYSDEKFDEALKRIRTTTDLADAVKDADIVIEAVPENIDLKHKVWKQVSEVAPDHAVLATNSSYFIPSEITPAISHPERFGALHFANNVWRQNTGEVMGHAGTDPKVLDAIAQFAEEINLRVFRVQKETRGYLLNAQLVPLMTSAAKLYGSGAASFDEINEAFKVGLGIPFGVIQIFDVVGFGVAYEINAISDDPDVREFAKALKIGIDNGKTGLATGEGFYVYGPDGKPTGLSKQLPEIWGAE